MKGFHPSARVTTGAGFISGAGGPHCCEPAHGHLALFRTLPVLKGQDPFLSTQ